MDLIKTLTMTGEKSCHLKRAHGEHCVFAIILCKKRYDNSAAKTLRVYINGVELGSNVQDEVMYFNQVSLSMAELILK